MHVLFVTQAYPPEVGATGYLLAELTEDLISQGIQTTVLAGSSSSQGLGDSGGTTTPEGQDGVRVVRSPSTRFRRTSFLGRMANWLSYPAASLLRGMAGLRRPDLVVCYSAPPTAPPVGYLLAMRWRVPFVLYVQDIYPDVAEAVGVMRAPILGSAWRLLNRALYRRAAMVLTLGEYMADRLRGAGVPDGRLAVIHNWADGRCLYPLPRDQNPMREALGLADRFVVLYSGNLGMAHDFRHVCEALVRLYPYRERLAFLFVGDGVRRREVEAFVRREGLEELVLFLSSVRQEDLLQSLNMGDACLLIMLEGTEGVVVPSKLYAYLAVGRPVLAVCSGPCEVSDILEEAGCGFVARTGEELAGAVLALMEDEQMRVSMGHRARAALDARFERRQATARIAEVLINVQTESG